MSMVEIPPDLEAWAKDQVAAGRAQSVEDVVAMALRQRQMDEEHRALVLEAYGQIERGELISEEEMDAQFERWLKEDGPE